MTMKILIAGEGVSEIGRERTEGSLVVLVRRILNCEAEFSVIKSSSPVIGTFRPRRSQVKEYGKRAMGLLKYATEQGFDAVVMLVDRDGERERDRQVEDVQQSHLFPIRRAFGVPIEAYDSWMLADETALSTITNKSIPLQPMPETLPRGQSKELVESIIGTDGKADLYAALIGIARFDSLRSRCPLSFVPFERNVLMLVNQ